MGEREELAAFAPVIALPAFAAAVLVFQREEALGAFGGGDSFAYGVVAALLVCLPLIGWCAKPKSGVLPAAIPLSIPLVPLVVGALGFALQFRAGWASLTKMSVIDRESFISAVANEALPKLSLGLFAASSAWVAFAMAFAARAGWRMTTVGVVMALLTGAEALWWDALVGVLSALRAEADQGLWSRRLAAALEAEDVAQRWRLGAAGSVLVCAGLTAWRRTSVPGAVAAVVVLLVTVRLPRAVVEANFVRATPEPRAGVLHIPANASELVDAHALIEGQALRLEGEWLEPGATARARLAAVIASRPRIGCRIRGLEMLGYDLAEDARASTVEAAMRLAFAAGASRVALCGAAVHVAEDVERVPTAYRAFVFSSTACLRFEPLPPGTSPDAELRLGPNGFTLEPEAAVTQDALVLATPQGELQPWLDALARIEAKGAVAVLRIEE